MSEVIMKPAVLLKMRFSFANRVIPIWSMQNEI